MKSKWSRAEIRRFRLLLFCTLASGALLWAATRYSDLRPKPQPFKFPLAELAAIDRDLQARFAVVPDKDFGIERAYGNQHYLYDPQTPEEHASVAALKKRDTEVAFYLMSRALWLRSWDGAGYKPIQGPVLLTGKLTRPLPRRINFQPLDNSVREPIINQDNAGGTTGNNSAIDTHSPDGEVVPSPTPPKGAPSFNKLQEIGNRVFELAEAVPVDAKIGVNETINKQWKVAAVPIRASNKACLKCHIYQPLRRNPNATSRTTVKLGDALGVAFYLYNAPLELTKPNANVEKSAPKAD